MGKVGRNEPCPCGSGKKYKKCCQADRITTQAFIVDEIIENETCVICGKRASSEMRHAGNPHEPDAVILHFARRTGTVHFDCLPGEIRGSIYH